MLALPAASVFDHVLDTSHWHFFTNLHLEFTLPFGLTKFMVLMVIAALLVIWMFVPLAKRVETGEPPRGAWWNLLETILVFIRDQVARPYIGHHDEGHKEGHAEPSHAPAPATPSLALEAAGATAHVAADAHAGDAHGHHSHGHGHEENEADRYVPFLWTMFLFILMCNLLGLVPMMGSPTGAFSVTVALAIIAFFAIHGCGIYKQGFFPYMKNIVPSLDLPLPIKIFVLLLLAPIEFLGHFIKAFVLAVRLFANIFAGHMVLAVLLTFIVAVKDQGPALFWGVTSVTVAGLVALSMLELFVAFLQAFIFVFLTSLFLGSALNPEH